MDAEADLPQLIDAHVTRALDTDPTTVVALLAGALAEALHAIGSDQDDQRRTVAVGVATAAVPASLDRLTAAVVDRHWEMSEEAGDRFLDVSNVAALVAAIHDVVLESEDPSYFIDAFVVRTLGRKEKIGETGEDASYGPGHDNSILCLESFTWKGAVWAYGYGSPDLMEPYSLWFLHRDGDREGRRRALVGLASDYAGAGLENHDDPEVRHRAREESWLVHAERFNWYEPLDEWEVWGTSEPTEELIRKHGLLIADRLGRRLSEVETVIRSLEEPDDDDMDGGDYGQGLPVLEQDVRRELWWILNDTT